MDEQVPSIPHPKSKPAMLIPWNLSVPVEAGGPVFAQELVGGGCEVTVTDVAVTVIVISDSVEVGSGVVDDLVTVTVTFEVVVGGG